MYELLIPRMSCGHCVKALTSAIHGIDATAALQFSVDTHKVLVETSAALDTLTGVLAAAGYPVETITARAAEPAMHNCDQCD